MLDSMAAEPLQAAPAFGDEPALPVCANQRIDLAQQHTQKPVTFVTSSKKSDVSRNETIELLQL